MSNRPFARIVAKHKETGTTYEVGTLWNSKFDGTYNLTPVVETALDATYPRMSLAEAITSGEYWLNAHTPREKTEDFEVEF